jgi:N-acetylmuramoyl-L-alanine amidase
MVGCVIRVVAVLAAATMLAGCGGSPGRADADRSTTSRVVAHTTTTTVVTRDPDPAPTGHTPVEADQAQVVLVPDGLALPVRGRNPDGSFVVLTPCAVEGEVREGVPVGRADVVIDPGHGGDEDGAVGADGLAEKAVNLDVALRLRDLLVDDGLDVVLTRTRDHRVTLETRAEAALALQPRLFLSLHHNADPDGPSERPGTESYYQVDSPDSKRLAGLVHEELVASFSPYEIPWMADRDAGAKYRTSERGGDFYGILRRTAGVPTVLSEAAFISNPAEEELLGDPDFRQVEAEALAAAVARYLTTDDPGSGYVDPYPRSSSPGSTGGPDGCVDPVLG